MKCIFIFILLLLISCNLFITKNSIPGTYVFNHNKFSIDTLVIFKNKTYQKKLYSKSTKKKHVVNGTWEYENKGIILHNFLPNDNANFLADNYQDCLITAEMDVTYINGNIAIEESGDDFNYYYKIVGEE